jgi:hypothetical protein
LMPNAGSAVERLAHDKESQRSLLDREMKCWPGPFSLPNGMNAWWRYCLGHVHAAPTCF